MSDSCDDDFACVDLYHDLFHDHDPKSKEYNYDFPNKNNVWEKVNSISPYSFNKREISKLFPQGICYLLSTLFIKYVLCVFTLSFFVSL